MLAKCLQCIAIFITFFIPFDRMCLLLCLQKDNNKEKVGHQLCCVCRMIIYFAKTKKELLMQKANAEGY